MNTIKVDYVDTEDQQADMLTKAFRTKRLELLFEEAEFASKQHSNKRRVGVLTMSAAQ